MQGTVPFSAGTHILWREHQIVRAKNGLWVGGSVVNHPRLSVMATGLPNRARIASH